MTTLFRFPTLESDETCAPLGRTARSFKRIIYNIMYLDLVYTTPRQRRKIDGGGDRGAIRLSKHGSGGFHKSYICFVAISTALSNAIAFVTPIKKYAASPLACLACPTLPPVIIGYIKQSRRFSGHLIFIWLYCTEENNANY